eukprot:scaffold14594_cov19-Tisochrysis_lutea.AAC.1
MRKAGHAESGMDAGNALSSWVQDCPWSKSCLSVRRSAAFRALLQLDERRLPALLTCSEAFVAGKDKESQGLRGVHYLASPLPLMGGLIGCALDKQHCFSQDFQTIHSACLLAYMLWFCPWIGYEKHACWPTYSGSGS